MSEKRLSSDYERLTYLERIVWLHYQLLAGSYPKARTIAERFEVSEKTAYRTIDFMRDRFHAPIDYSREHQGYYYTEPTFSLPLINLTEGEMLALLLAERMASAYRGTAIAPLIEQAFGKVLNAMTDIIS